MVEWRAILGALFVIPTQVRQKGHSVCASELKELVGDGRWLVEIVTGIDVILVVFPFKDFKHAEPTCGARQLIGEVSGLGNVALWTPCPFSLCDYFFH